MRDIIQHDTCEPRFLTVSCAAETAGKAETGLHAQQVSYNERNETTLRSRHADTTHSVDQDLPNCKVTSRALQVCAEKQPDSKRAGSKDLVMSPRASIHRVCLVAI